MLQTSEDGWTCGTPLAALTDDRDALLAVAMNGRAAAARARVPGADGGARALRLRLGDQVGGRPRGEPVRPDSRPSGPARAGPSRGRCGPSSRIDVPRAATGVTAGEVRVGGVAWAQHTGIEAVEVAARRRRLDRGRARSRAVRPTPGCSGRAPSTLEPGVHTLAVRATDRRATSRPGCERDVVPDGATGWHTVEFTAEERERRRRSPAGRAAAGQRVVVVGDHVDQPPTRSVALEPGVLELAAVVGPPHAAVACSAAGSLTTTSPFRRKPTITSRWPLVEEIGAPSSSPGPNDTEATSGIPAAMNRSAWRRLRSRVTNAGPPVRPPAYAVLNGQLPVPP